MRTSYITVTLCALVLVLALTSVQVQSSPVQYSKWEEYVKMFKDDDGFINSKDNKCRHGGEVRNLCEKCAKVTKNEVVFPLCCQNKIGVAAWCKEFLDYRPVEPVLSS
ncbi:uncharacterized protein LOC129972183 [Argiope bruennichi]|uniref:Uncharacterized protein n=1 Tax=Argiope bruennichi TaxID=94029 RepID=A0A8T0F7A4_ARGBR|nr:uncharacterized protein LOC129972183 [Argiope bruennichi]KAF8786208.1 hypothetical protein HNY73_007960 [Argiope bruennichi]